MYMRIAEASVSKAYQEKIIKNYKKTQLLKQKRTNYSK